MFAQKQELLLKRPPALSLGSLPISHHKVCKWESPVRKREPLEKATLGLVPPRRTYFPGLGVAFLKKSWNALYVCVHKGRLGKGQRKMEQVTGMRNVQSPASLVKRLLGGRQCENTSLQPLESRTDSTGLHAWIQYSMRQPLCQAGGRFQVQSATSPVQRVSGGN